MKRLSSKKTRNDSRPKSFHNGSDTNTRVSRNPLQSSVMCCPACLKEISQAECGAACLYSQRWGGGLPELHNKTLSRGNRGREEGREGGRGGQRRSFFLLTALFWKQIISVSHNPRNTPPCLTSVRMSVIKKRSLMAHACKSGSWEVKAGGLRGL